MKTRHLRIPRLRPIVAAIAATIAVLGGSLVVADPAWADYSEPSGFTLTSPLAGFENVNESSGWFYGDLTGDPSAATFNWGDGTTSSATMSGCSNNINTPGSCQASAEHLWNTPGTYTVTLKYSSAGSHTATWTVVSGGIAAPLYVPRNTADTTFTVSPNPVADIGTQIYWGDEFHEYDYNPGTKVTVTAHGAAARSWSTWGCDYSNVQSGSSGACYASPVSLPLTGQQDNVAVTLTVPADTGMQSGQGPDWNWTPPGTWRALQYTGADTNLVTNGGFEQPALGSGAWNVYAGSNGSVPGWASGANGIEIDNASDSAGGGSQYTELDAYHPTWVNTTATLVPGATYQLSFEYAGRPGYNASDNAMYLGTNLPIANQGSAWFSDNATGVGSHQWKLWSATFTATSSLAKIALTDGGYDDGYGMALDNVRLVRVS